MSDKAGGSHREVPKAQDEEQWTHSHHVSHVHTYSQDPMYVSGERAYQTDGTGGQGTQGAAAYKAACAAGVKGMGASSATARDMGQETSGMVDYNSADVAGMDGGN